LEHLFGLYLPAFGSDYPSEVLKQRQGIVKRHFNHDWSERVQIARAESLPVAERIKIARSYPNPRVVVRLSNDDDLDVTMAAIQSPWCPRNIRWAIDIDLRKRSLKREYREVLNSVRAYLYAEGADHEIGFMHSLYRSQDNRQDPIWNEKKSPELSDEPVNSDWRAEVATASLGRAADIFSATTFGELVAAIDRIRSESATAEVREIAFALISKVENTNKLQFDVADRHPRSFAFLSTTIPNSLIDMKIASVIVVRPISSFVASFTLQDIGIEGGRAAWALEELFGVYLPCIQLGISHVEITARQAMIYKLVIDTDWPRRVATARLRQLSVDERVELAFTNYNPRLQLTLARDEERRVRIAIASNLWMHRLAGEAKWVALRSCPDMTLNERTENLKLAAKLAPTASPKSWSDATVRYSKWLRFPARDQ
jgi:hypothetical protein